MNAKEYREHLTNITFPDAEILSLPIVDKLMEGYHSHKLKEIREKLPDRKGLQKMFGRQSYHHEKGRYWKCDRKEVGAGMKVVNKIKDILK